MLNPFAASRCPDGHQERVVLEGEASVRFCPGARRLDRELAAVSGLWWATGWGANANELYLPLLGVDPLPVVQFPPVPFEPELKVSAIDAVAGDRPAVWIDDNHTAVGCNAPRTDAADSDRSGHRMYSRRCRLRAEVGEIHGSD